VGISEYSPDDPIVMYRMS